MYYQMWQKSLDQIMCVVRYLAPTSVRRNENCEKNCLWPYACP